MGAIFFGAADAMRRKRRCAKCGRDQIVPREKSRDKVQCKWCGADIPPPSKR